MKQWASAFASIVRSTATFLIVSIMMLLGGTAHAIAPGSKPTFAVLGPLFISSPQEFTDFDTMLAEAKNIGVQAVSIDVWWGIVQPTSANNFDWSYYDNVFGRIRNNGMKIIPILSFHKCGGGPGDTCNIPIPAWVFNLVPDMKYQSGKGNTHDDAVSVWATKEPVVLTALRNFMQNFGTHFNVISGDFSEVNVSLGPTGELRYPSYNANDIPPEWSYETDSHGNYETRSRGVFQFYSGRAGDDFRQWALNNFGGLPGVNQRWGFNLSSPSEIRVPQNHDDFITNHNYENMQYGRDVIDWYNGSLVDHGARMLATAHQALTATMPSVPLGMKIPGVHWQIQNTTTPRIAEITAGLVQTTKGPVSEARKDAFGYEAIMDMVANAKANTGRDLILHFTAVEMDNDPPSCQPPKNNTSMADALVFWTSNGATDRDITHKAENALGCVNGPDGACDNRNWELISNVFDFAPYGGLSFLRLSRLPDNFGCVPWSSEDQQNYANFIQAFQNDRMVVVHLSEWEPCFFQTDGCSYNIFTWNNGKPRPWPFGLHYEGPQFSSGGQVCRQWWTGVVANVSGGFEFTGNHAIDNNTTWEGQPGQFDRVYNPSQGNEIFVLGRQNASVFTTRPPCP